MDNDTGLLPPVMRAIVQKKPEAGRDDDFLEMVTVRRIPQPRPDELLIRVHAVAVNPCDWKMPQLCAHPGAGAGTDLAGTVVATGAEAERLGFRVGDHVASAVHGANPGDPTAGAFADYACCVAALAWRVPPDMPWTTAAALGGCGIGTAGLALFTPETMGLEFPGLVPPGDGPKAVPRGPRGGGGCDGGGATPGPHVLVYGGSTAAGTMATQLLARAGYRPLVTCSPTSFALAAAYGAEACFDYKSESCVADIKVHTQGRLRYVLDCITDARSIATCEAALGRGGGRYVGLEALPADVLSGAAGYRTRSVRWTWVLGISLIGRGEMLPEPYHFEFSRGRRDWSEAWFHGVVPRLVDEGALRAHPIKVMSGGLERIPDGVYQVQKGLVRGEKLVYVV